MHEVTTIGRELRRGVAELRARPPALTMASGPAAEPGEAPDPFDRQVARRELRADVAGQLRDKLNRLRLTLVSNQASDQQPHHAALHDPLTTLPNRAHFRLRLGQSQALLLRAGRSLGLLYLGMNGCKQVTTTHSQVVADECVRIVAARLRHALRIDDVIGRVGGAEFACMWPDVSDPKLLATMAGRLLAAVAAPIRIGSIELSMSASAGIAMFPRDGQGTEELIGDAAAAMFRARREHGELAFYGQPIGH